MRVADFNTAELQTCLLHRGLDLVTGFFTTRIHTSIESVAAGLARTYADFPAAPASGFADFHCRLRAPLTWRRYYHPQVLFLVGRRSVFKPLPFAQAYPLLEWGMNWCIANQVRHQLIFHAAAVERGGQALLLTGPPGSGKSTLCAALANRGWRLLSDETTLVDLETGMVSGPGRPVSLKNASIEAVAAFAPAAEFSAPCHDTLKGRVAHMRPPAQSVARAGEPATPSWIVFPRFALGGQTCWQERETGQTLLGLAANAFNYAALGRVAFNRTAELVAQAAAFDLTYANLDEAVQVIDELAK